MEIVEIVDKKLNILYKISKQEAHEKGLLHKCVVAEVINSKGEIMLIKPYSHRQDGGQYVSPVGGHVASGESDEEALKREVLEEIGMKDFEYQLKGKGIFNRFILNRQENHYFLIYQIFTDEVPQLGDEAQTYKWFTKDELTKELRENVEDFGDAYIFILKRFYPELLKQ